MGQCRPGRGDGAQAGLVTLEMQTDDGPREYWEVEPAVLTDPTLSMREREGAGRTQVLDTWLVSDDAGY